MNYNAMIKIDIKDLIDIIDIKNKRLSDKNGVTNVPYIFSKQKLCKEMYFIKFCLIEINKLFIECYILKL